MEINITIDELCISIIFFITVTVKPHYFRGTPEFVGWLL